MSMNKKTMNKSQMNDTDWTISDELNLMMKVKSKNWMNEVKLVN
jgi:hypothetical protein